MRLMGMGSRQDKLSIVVLISLVTCFLIVFGYEVYVYTCHTGKAYTTLYVQKADEGEGYRIRVVLRGAKPMTITQPGSDKDVADSSTYRDQRKTGQASVRFDEPGEFVLHLTSDRTLHAAVTTTLFWQGNELAHESSDICFTPAKSDSDADGRQGTVKIALSEGRMLSITAGDGVTHTSK